MKGLLKEKSEIEKLKKEYQILAKFNFDLEKKPINPTVIQEELILEECTL
jgi:hypothetical protein